MKKSGKCVHFNGVQNKVCAKGIDYETIPKPVACIFPAGREGNPNFCPHYQEPTAEEIAADEAEVEAILAKHRVVMGEVHKWRTWTKNNRVGKAEVIKCPACNGHLHLSQSAYNGHVHGKCETAGCVSWME